MSFSEGGWHGIFIRRPTWILVQSRGIVCQEQKRFIYRLLTRHDFLPVWLVVDKYLAWSLKIMYRTDCCAAHPVLLNRLSRVNRSEAADWPGRSSFISGELKSVEYSIYLCLTGELFWPPRRPPWTACVHFPDLYPIDVFHLSFKFLCLLLL